MQYTALGDGKHQLVVLDPAVREALCMNLIGLVESVMVSHSASENGSLYIFKSGLRENTLNLLVLLHRKVVDGNVNLTILPQGDGLA